AQVSKVFGEFYRVDSPEVRAQEGLGLGLSIVKRIADLLGLQVKVNSQPQRGTIVAICGLQTVAAPSPGQMARPSRKRHPLAGRRIVLIDDDQQVLDATTALLGRWGCEVLAFRAAPLEPTGC